MARINPYARRADAMSARTPRTARIALAGVAGTAPLIAVAALAALVGLSGCELEATDGFIATASQSLSHAPVAHVTASATVTAVQGSPVRFPAQFQADQVIGIYDTNRDGVIDTADGLDTHTFPVAVATPYNGGRRIGSSIQVGIPPGPGFCGDLLVYAVDNSGPVAGQSYFLWLALRSPGYQPGAFCSTIDADVGVGAFVTSTGAVVHHETLIGGLANNSQLSGFSWWLDVGAGTPEWPGRLTVDSITTAVVNEITGTFNRRVTLSNVSIDVPILHDGWWDGVSAFGAGPRNTPSSNPDARLAMYANAIGADLEDPQRVHYADVSGDGRDDLCVVEEHEVVCAEMGADRRYRVLRPWSTEFGWRDLGSFPYWKTVRFPDLDGNGRADICAYTQYGVRCAISNGQAFGASQLWDTQMTYWSGWTTYGRYNTIRFPDVNGDGKADLCGRSWDGIHCAVGNGSTGFYGMFLTGARFSDARGFGTEDKWGTIQYGDLDGDGRDDVCARGVDGIYCARSPGNGFSSDSRWHDNFRDSYGWNADQYWRTIRLGDVNNDGTVDLCGRGTAGVYCTPSLGGKFASGLGLVGPAFSNANGWSDPKYYTTLSLVDISGDGAADICGRGSAGVWCAIATPDPYTRHIHFGAAALTFQAFGDTPHRSPGSAAVGDSSFWYQTLRPVDIDTDAAEELCGITPWGVECTD